MARSTWRTLAVVGMCGAVGGAANAWLCLQRIPEPVGRDPSFRSALVPGGALHGAALAVVAVGCALLAATWRRGLRVPFGVPVGWIAGYVSFIPLSRWALDESWRKSLLWPFQDSSWLSVASTPFLYFGLVSVMYFLAVRTGGRRNIVLNIAYGVCAGVLGSLYFWIQFKPWYFAVIHGTIWGALVGAGAYWANGPAGARKPGVA